MDFFQFIRGVEKLILLVFLYIIPAYNSYRCIKKEDKEISKTLLHFWVAVLIQDFLWTVIQPFMDRVIGFGLELRFVFTIWLVHPFFSGFEWIYNTVVHKWLLKYEEKIESVLQRMHDFSWRYYTIAFQYITKKVQGTASRVNEMVH